MRNFEIRPTVERLKDVFEYDPRTGELFRKHKKGLSLYDKTKKGGYIQVMVDGWRGRAHQVAYAMHHGEWSESPIDHINGVKSDNRACNLRGATASENARNQPRFNVTDCAGKFRAQICVGKKRIHLGVFPELEQARAAVAFADVMLNKEFAWIESKEVVHRILAESLLRRSA